jgi:uncharacterized protein Yka (UPF0111/DUF47 family)
MRDAKNSLAARVWATPSHELNGHAEGGWSRDCEYLASSHDPRRQGLACCRRVFSYRWAREKALTRRKVNMFGGSRKDQVFYGAFRDQAQVTRDAATKFASLLDDLGAAEQLRTDIHHDKQRGDEILSLTLRELHATWITPFDRHHIHELVDGIDKVLTLLDSTASRIVLFGIREVRSEARDLARNVIEVCGCVCSTVALMPKLSRDSAQEVLRLAGEIHTIEGRSEEIHQRALSTLFDGSSEPLQVMKWREVFDNLQSATSVCRNVARLFEAIVIENA